MWTSLIPIATNLLGIGGSKEPQQQIVQEEKDNTPILIISFIAVFVIFVFAFIVLQKK